MAIILSVGIAYLYLKYNRVKIIIKKNQWGNYLMPSAKVNRTAKNNGEWGEKIAPDILSDKFANIEYLNQTIDFYAMNNIPIEVKTCQFFINRNDERGNGKRFGRFTFNKHQHEILLHKKGYYLLLVKHKDLIHKARIIKAEDIALSISDLRKQYTWKFVMK
jgi:hypothetical protein